MFKFKKEVKRNGRLYCPCCGEDTTIIKIHEGCMWSTDGKTTRFAKYVGVPLTQKIPTSTKNI